jgi:hypothetical protein
MGLGESMDRRRLPRASPRVVVFAVVGGVLVGPLSLISPDLGPAALSAAGRIT